MQTNILGANPDAAIRVYAIFCQIVAGDKGAKYEVDPHELLDDPWVTHFWDERRLTGRWFDENVTRIGKRTGEEGASSGIRLSLTMIARRGPMTCRTP